MARSSGLSCLGRLSLARSPRFGVWTDGRSGGFIFHAVTQQLASLPPSLRFSAASLEIFPSPLGREAVKRNLYVSISGRGISPEQSALSRMIKMARLNYKYR